jgi:hypothetical protein
LNVAIEQGFAANGYANLNLGISYIHNDKTGQQWLAPSISFATGRGNLTEQASGYPSSKDSSDIPFVAGIFGGISPFLSGTYSPDANTPDDLAGTANQSSLNAPLLSVSTQKDAKGSYSYTVSGGVKGLASVSKYPVQTWVPASLNLNSGQVGYSAVTSATINYIQAQINYLKSAISAFINNNAGSQSGASQSKKQ